MTSRWKSFRRLLVLGCIGAGQVRAAGRWLVAKTPHFEMYSDASRAESQRILVGLEEFRANFLHVIPLNGASEPRATVVVFDRESEFRPYKPLYQGKPRDVAGYFLSRPDEVFIAMTTDYPNPAQDPLEVIYHEYVHLLLDARQAHYPVWLNEGLAEVFSTFRFADGKVVYGEPKTQHLALLQRSALWPLPRVFAVTPDSPDYNEDDRTGTFYAESWAFTHYLLFGADKGNAGKLNQFAQRLSAGYDVPTSFQATFGRSFATVQNALWKYLNGGGYFKGTNPAVAQNLPVNFRPASDLERDTALLNLRWRVRQNPDAAAAALALLDKDPTQPRPHELLAAIALAADDPQGAHEHWLKAAELNSDNPWVYLQLLREAMEPYEGATMLDTRLAADLVAPWRGWARRAGLLSPENHEAMEDALTVEALADKMDIRVVNRVQKPAVQGRDPARAWLDLAVIHWRGGQPDNARDLLEMAEAQPRADMATRAAAAALRDRLPAVAELPAAQSAMGATTQPRIALDQSHQNDAAKFLDTLLAQRGSTAPPFELDRFVAHQPAAAGPDVWQRTEETRQRAQAGDAAAMYDLAEAYACGSGVEYSPSLAQEWLQRALQHGQTLAPGDSGAAQGDAVAVVLYLRSHRPASQLGGLPPLDVELDAKIAQAAAAAERRLPEVVYRGTPRMPGDLREHGGKSEAVVRFNIAEDGHPDHVLARAFSDSAAAAAAEADVRAWRFLPTIRDGKPIGTLAEVTIVFQADGPAAPSRPAAPSGRSSNS